MFLEGAELKNGILGESRDKILYTQFPIIWLKPIEKNRLDLTQKRYFCPVYKTSKRAGVLSTTGLSTNYVISLYIPIHKN